MAPPPSPAKLRRSPPPSLPQLLDSLLSVPLEPTLRSADPNLALVAFQLGSTLSAAATRSLHKLNSAHNSVVWPLPTDLTIKVLGLVDTASLCYASVSCKGLRKFGSEPLCYSEIDLTRNWSKVSDSVVCMMIQRAGKNLKSIKIGADSRFDSEGNLNEPPLTRSCLDALSLDNIGALLQNLCLRHIHDMDKTELVNILSSCKSLLDLEIVGLNAGLGGIMKAVSIHCPSIERLCFDYSDFCMYMIKFDLARITGLTKLKYVDFSASLSLKGSFLRNLGDVNGPGDLLETLILRDCPSLQSDEFAPFFYAALAGKWKSLRFIDLTSKCRDYIVCRVRVFQSFKERRPDICLLVNSPYDEEYFSDEENFSDDEISENVDEQNTDDDYSSEDQNSQNGEDQSLNDSSDDEISRTEDKQNLDSSSD
ncbi:hypothetical protein LUZ60_017716 [Juncus effusus]|nr:hypothetical protein LUZ60_017716 [Juncus effusus]